jgi:hypothetical protein
MPYRPPRTVDRALVGIFLATITLPLAATLAGVEGADPIEENRTFAPFPALAPTWSALSGSGPGLTSWFDDHFAFRSTLVRWDAALRFRALGVSPTSSIVAGREGWLFYADDGAVEEFGRLTEFEPEGLANWRKTIKRTGEWLEHQGTAYVFTVAPDKHLVYPEFLPTGITPIGERSKVDQLFEALAGVGSALDLRPALAAGRASARVYHRTDTHWNDCGAWIAYREIIEAVRRQVPQIAPAWPRTDFAPVRLRVPAGDLAGMMGLRRVLDEHIVTLVPRRVRRAQVIEPAGGVLTAHHGWLVTEIPGSTLPRAVVFRDSFTSALVPFLSEHFSRVVYTWQQDFDAPLIEREGPDVVIQEIVSRHLYTFAPTPGLIPD